MKKIKSRMLALLMVLIMCIGQFNVVFANDGVAGYVTVAVEKFTLGQGYYIEPVNVPFYENEKVGSVVARVLGDGKYNKGRNSSNISYLANVYDPNPGAVKIPAYIMNKLEDFGGVEQTTHTWLGEFDYSVMSGWMYFVNNDMPDVGMNNYVCHNGDVIRLEFTLYGYGTDLGVSSEWSGPALIPVANKDQLTKLVADINGRPDKAVLLQSQLPNDNATVGDYYDTAIFALTNMETEQAMVDLSYAALQDAVNSAN
ncbi:DUF4430 domain-containing protein [Cellulosilyticum ruminicola]|uniref:DUF4430 domain-containing protein n=1 Tax=Cellulosilyticum ruminicola TaxID=425254 RepID=UPI0006D2C21D|nr:DUF4430 domain-containing protein [Cellulosilyticum ruminicola]